MSTIEHTAFPWGAGSPDPSQVYVLSIDSIVIPTLRVTSTFNPEQKAELNESLKTEGQKDPIKCIWTNQQVVLADGFNRIEGLSLLGVQVVKALVQPGTMADVQIANVITARHRGKENPAQTAEVIKDLIDNEHLDKSEIKQRLGLTDATFRRLFAISTLPDEVKDHIKFSRLGVGAAYHIAQLGDSAKQIILATQAVNWGYTEEQVKAAVTQILNPGFDASTQPVVFSADGAPKVVYPKCTGCNIELQAVVYPINCCEDCYQAAKAFFQQYNAPADPVIEAMVKADIIPRPDTGFIQE